MTPSLIQSALHPAGIQAARIEALWWVMFWICAVTWLLVMAALGVALARGRTGRSTAIDARALGRVVAGAVLATVVTLIGLLSASVFTGRALALRAAPDQLVIEITGHQWWWGVEYVHPDPSLRVTTANELRVPTGRPITVQMKSADVIHSFWVPNLHDKMDLVPGRLNTTWFTADTAGSYRGQCAEFCGLQHAHMGLLVVAEPPEAFERWIAAQRAAPPEPSTPQQLRGRELFEQGPCAMCHTVRGTIAGGRTGPDLTHVGSRRTLAAGTLPNTPADLARWLADPQGVKPGNRMPPTGLRDADVQALVAYLESLR